MNVIKYCIDLLFPPSVDTLLLRNITAPDIRESCREAPFAEFPFITSIFSYRDILVKKAIWQLKYKHNKDIASLFGGILAEELILLLADKQSFGYFMSPLLIPIPLSREKRSIRTYNQCELLITEALKYQTLSLCTPCFDVLIKSHHTESQARTHSKKERLENLQDSFRIIHKERIYNKDIILIDDVTTTGATLYEARKTLVQYGARDVIALALAH